MIPARTRPVDHFELMEWARRQPAEHHLTVLEAHVLLLLAARANREAIAWPSVRRLAEESGLTVTAKGNNSAISTALGRLQELGLIWTKQSGRGPAQREVLMPEKPSGRREGTVEAQPSASQEGNGQPFAPAKGEPDGAASAPAAQRFAITKGESEHAEAQPFATAKTEAAQPSTPALRQEPAQPFAVAKPKYQRKNQNGRRPRTSTPEGPDDALRHGEERPPTTTEKTGNSHDQAALADRLADLMAERHPDQPREQIRLQVDRHRRAGTLEQFRPLLDGRHHDPVPATVAPPR